MKRKVKGIYYRKILIFLLLFLCGVVIPFTMLLYERAKINVMNNINESNERILDQMNENYQIFSENISSICMSIFFRYDVQKLIYNQTQDYNEIYSTVKDLNSNITQMLPFVHSVVMYNGANKSYFSTEDSEGMAIEEVKSFLKQNSDIPKLKPILRQVSLRNEPAEIKSWVFSYFMYEYDDPSNGQDSFIVLNQTTDAFLDSLTYKISEKSDAMTSAYIATKNGEIYGGDFAVNATQKNLVKECLKEKVGENENGFYTTKYKKQKYLVSYICLEEKNSYLVMVQGYEDIFENMIQLQREFWVFGSIYIIVALGIIFLISLHIYNPVNEMVKHFSKPSENDEIEIVPALDEFGQIRHILQKTNHINQTLKLERKESQTIMKNYWLGSLLNESSEENWKLCCEKIPGISSIMKSDMHMVVMCLQLEEYQENKYQFSDKDHELLLGVIKNVIQEILESDFISITINRSSSELILILNSRDREDVLGMLKKCTQDMQKFILKHFDVTVSGFYSTVGTNYKLLSNLYQEAELYKKYKVLYGPGCILGEKECIKNIKNNNTSYSPKLKKSLDEKLKLGNKEQIFQILDEIQIEISKLSYEYMVINLLSLITRVSLTFHEISKAKNKPFGMDFSSLYYRGLNLVSLDRLFVDLKECIENILSENFQVKEKALDKDDLFVKTVMELVEENYTNKNFSSQFIAEYMKLSCQYVMKKFKMQTGISLNEYILNIRMNQASYLLTKTDMSICQIADNVGIENENYFYRLFKKVYGCTPREFTQKNKN